MLHSTTDRGSRDEPLVRRPPVALVAEDDLLMRRLVVLALRRDGFEVIEATDGAALDSWVRRIFEHREPQVIDLIISDQRMPIATGLDVLARLRRASWSTPFILITAFGDQATHAEAVRLGAALVLDKPFDLGDLRAAALRLAAVVP